MIVEHFILDSSTLLGGRLFPPERSDRVPAMYPVSRSSRRLRLRELSIDGSVADDVSALFAIYGSPKATEHLSFEPRTRDQVAQIVSRSVASAVSDPRSEYAVAVVEKETERMIGFGRIALDPHQPNGATFGFALRPDAWGVGYGAETLRLLLGLGFEEIGLHRIWGGRSPLNEASARTMAAVGMIEEGTIRGHVRKAGQWRDSIVHSMLEEEWRGGLGSGGGSRPGRGE